MSNPLPVYFIPHGAGPCFFMDWEPKDAWAATADWLSSIGREPGVKAILVISGHWEAPDFTVTSAPNPALIYDYYGFPDHTYHLSYPAAGSPLLAERIVSLLDGQGLAAKKDEARGFDHGVFIPLMLVRAEADLPVVQLSLKAGLDPSLHLALGRALALLRHEGVLILGSGMSFHNMRGYGDPAFTPIAERFDGWLGETVAAEPAIRAQRLAAWSEAPAARLSHPREEHLLPLMVAAGAAGDDPGRIVFSDRVMEVPISGVRFG